jgi:peroxiredoxin
MSYVFVLVLMNRFIISSLLLFSAVFMITDAQNDTTTLARNGDMSPVFKCVTIDGKIFDLSKLRDKIVMLNFFTTWCPPCNQELPALQENIWKKYRDNEEFVLLVIGREHNNDVVAEFVAEKRFVMPFAADPDRAVYSLFATQYIPRNVIIDRGGKIIFQNRGYTSREFKMIEELLAEKLKK